MSNQRYTSNFNANNDGDSHSSSDENEEHSRTSNNRHSTRVNISRAEPDSNETSHDLEPMTNEQINRLILHQVDHNEIPILSLEDWMIFMNRSTVQVHQSQLGLFNLPLNHYFHVNRDAQAEGRTDHPIDENFTFSTTVTVVDDEPLPIQDTQPHDREVLATLNNTQPTYIIINGEDDHLNEDATLYTNVHNNIIIPIVQNGINIQVMNNNENESPQIVVDDEIYNINPLDPVESQDDTESSGSSDKEDKIASLGSGFDGDDEYDSSDDNEERGQPLPTTEYLNGHIENNNQFDQTNNVNEQPVTTNTVLSRNQPLDIHNVSDPMEGVYRTAQVDNNKDTKTTQI
ncbi:unnamed protein product [Rotaria sordida]|uniref:Uncharacterized protein n=1 Tax=Rotaria sordida TaxID=392033 RepID=A0A815F0S8_9BILA|nr:unnamed protein product [Rotaria sordida]CAF1584722.1 unnamed protein product [Rotaria sordida]